MNAKQVVMEAHLVRMEGSASMDLANTTASALETTWDRLVDKQVSMTIMQVSQLSIECDAFPNEC